MCFYNTAFYLKKNIKTYLTILSLTKQKKPFLVILNYLLKLLKFFNFLPLINNFLYKIILFDCLPLPYHLKYIYFKKVIN